MMSHVCFSVAKDCLNLMDSYGEICVRCNCCGRFDKETMYECQLKMYEEQLQNQYEFDFWDEHEKMRKIQEENIKKNIKYYKNKIEEVKKILEVQNNA